MKVSPTFVFLRSKVELVHCNGFVGVAFAIVSTFSRY